MKNRIRKKKKYNWYIIIMNVMYKHKIARYNDNYACGWSLPVLLIRAFLMYVGGAYIDKVGREEPVLLIRVFLMYVGGV